MNLPRTAMLLAAPVAAAATLAAAEARRESDWRWQLPPGIPEPIVPADNPMSAAKVELGRHLFHDVRLSGNRIFSCASCHDQRLAFTDGLETSVGSTGDVHPRGSMSLANVAYGAVFNWANPNVRSLEDQALTPMFGDDPVELGLSGMEDELLRRLRAEQRYRVLFPASFPEDDDPFSVLNVTRALAAFQRTMISGNSAYDRAQHVDRAAMSESAWRGEELFFSETTECFHCHGGFNFAGSVNFAGKGFVEVEFHNNALYNVGGSGGYPARNLGLAEHTEEESDIGRFKAPTLRNIAVTAPYMHDGSIATLEEVLDHYMAGGRTIPDGPHAGAGVDNPNRSEFVRPFTLTPQQKSDLLEFLRALTDSTFLTDPKLSDPWQITDWTFPSKEKN